MMRAMTIAGTGMAAQELTIEVIANNLANVSTVGFKASSPQFQDLMYQTYKLAGTNTGTGILPVGIQTGSGVSLVAVQRGFGQGDFQQTGNSLDMAIEGDGFFQLTLPDGSTAYTRAGSFQLDSQGRIVTADGYPIIPSLSLPNDTESITISTTGVISVVEAANPTPKQVGTLELARFTNPAGLNSLGKNLYQVTPASGEAITGQPGLQGFGTILQGNLESSNVNIAAQMVNMISAQRAYELNSKAIQATDEMYSTVNNLLR